MIIKVDVNEITDNWMGGGGRRFKVEIIAEHYLL